MRVRNDPGFVKFEAYVIKGKKKKERKRISLIAQLVKNEPAMQETPVRFLDWDDHLEKG